MRKEKSINVALVLQFLNYLYNFKFRCDRLHSL